MRVDLPFKVWRKLISFFANFVDLKGHAICIFCFLNRKLVAQLIVRWDDWTLNSLDLLMIAKICDFWSIEVQNYEISANLWYELRISCKYNLNFNFFKRKLVILLLVIDNSNIIKIITECLPIIYTRLSSLFYFTLSERSWIC